MDIKYKLYPYPVLADYSDDYNDKVFNTSIDMVREGHNLRLDFVSELSSESIKKLIAEGKASYVYHIECAQTGFRDIILHPLVVISLARLPCPALCQHDAVVCLETVPSVIAVVPSPTTDKTVAYAVVHLTGKAIGIRAVVGIVVTVMM